jgi:hypothetical protein
MQIIAINLNENCYAMTFGGGYSCNILVIYAKVIDGHKTQFNHGF